jgi:hypothetical protein
VDRFFGNEKNVRKGKSTFIKSIAVQNILLSGFRTSISVDRVTCSYVSLVKARQENEHHRLVIAEHEEYLVDDESPYDNAPQNKDMRLVFVERFELTL